MGRIPKAATDLVSVKSKSLEGYIRRRTKYLPKSLSGSAKSYVFKIFFSNAVSFSFLIFSLVGTAQPMRPCKRRLQKLINP